MRNLSLLMLMVPLFAGCDDRRDVRDYYFPVRELINEQGLVYVYENTGTLPGPEEEYWYFLGVDTDTALYLSVTSYGPDMAPAQQSRERIRNDAVYLDELTLLPQDSTGRAQPVGTELLFDRVFPFYLDASDSQPYGYRMRYDPPETPGSTSYVTLNRIYRTDTIINVLGQDYDALVFDLAGEVSMRDPELGDISPAFGGYEIYARGLGRVEYKRELGSGASFGGRLKERVLMREFTERLRQ